MTIKTNYQERELMTWAELPENIQNKYKDDYDWTSEESMFFIYKGQPYCLGEFVKIENEYWHAGMTFTAFSGLYIKLSDDNEKIIVGYFYN